MQLQINVSPHLVRRRHGHLLHVRVVRPPHAGHVDEGPGADGAREVSRGDELVEAALVDEVVARGDLGWLPRGVDVLLADGAVRPGQVLDALRTKQ